MSPVSMTSASFVQTDAPSPILKAPALVIGSPASTQDGSYQKLISELEQTRSVEKLLVDRIVEGGMLQIGLGAYIPRFL